jgi:hypothetical protein
LRENLIMRKLEVWCLLLLAAVFAHALLPTNEVRTTGSPFSPSTVDVSTEQPRRMAPGQLAAAQPDPSDDALTVLHSGSTASTLAVLIAPREPGRTCAPERPGWRCTRAQPRAPPVA